MKKFLKAKIWPALPFLAILAVAAFFRFWALGVIPYGLYPDVAINGNDALDTLESGDFKMFYPENNGREGLWMWIIAGIFQVFGPGIWQIKLAAAATGFLTVLGLYFLAKEIFPGRIGKITALFGILFLATGFWHVNFSRIGFRAILVPFVTVFAFYFLFRAFRTARTWDYIFSAIFFAAGLYTYGPFRLCILALLAAFLFKIISLWQNRSKVGRSGFLISAHFIGWFAFALAGLLAVLPIGVYFLENPADFSGRAGQVSIFSSPNPLFAFAKSLAAHLAMFNFSGDWNWRHNYAGAPQLFWPVGLLFLFGIVLLGRKLWRGLRLFDFPTMANPAFLFSWFVAMLVGGILTWEGIPHSLRTIGAIPPAFLLAGYGAAVLFVYLKEKVYDLSGLVPRLLLLVSFFVLLASFTLSQFNFYFVSWARNSNTKGAFTDVYVAEAQFLNSLPEETRKFVLVNEGGVLVPFPDGIPMPAQTLMFIERAEFGRTRAAYITSNDISDLRIDGFAEIILMRKNPADVEILQAKFPFGFVKDYSAGFSVFEIPEI